MNLYPFAMTPSRPSVKYMLFATSPWILLYLLSIPGIFLIDPFCIILSLLLLMVLFYRFFLLAAELYIISPDMLMVSTGIVFKTVRWFEPLKIGSIKIRQTRLMKCFHVFNIRITSNEELNMSLTFKGADVDTFIEALRLNIDLLEARYAYTGLLLRALELVGSLEEGYGK